MSARDELATSSNSPDGELFAQYAQRWLATRCDAPSNHKTLKTGLNRYILPYFGGMQLAEIRASDMTAFDANMSLANTSRGQPLSRSRIVNVTRLAAQILRDALGRHAAKSLAAPISKLPPRPRHHAMGILGATGLQAMVDRADAAWKPYLVFRISAGINAAEIHSLKRDSLDLAQDLLYVGPPGQERAIPWNAGMRWAIAQQALRMRHLQSPFVFCNPSGGPLRETDFVGEVWQNALAGFGLPSYPPEQLQIETAYCWLGAGISAAQVADWTGLPFDEIKKHQQACKPPASPKTPEAAAWTRTLAAMAPVVLRQLSFAVPPATEPWQLARMSAVGLEKEVGFDPAKLDHSNLPVPQTPGALRWMEVYEQFRAVWEHRTTNRISESHPFRDWAHKQRAAYANAALPLWRLQHLRKLGFPLNAARVEEGSTNCDHAHSTVEFFRRYGHCCVSQQTAGAAVTKWFRSICATRGAVGLTVLPHDVDLQEDLGQALAILKDGIPGFDFTIPDKRQVNLEAGLTHNGYKPSARGKHKASGRLALVRERLRACVMPSVIDSPCGIVLPDAIQYVIGNAGAGLRVRTWETPSSIDLNSARPAGVQAEGWFAAGSTEGLIRIVPSTGGEEYFIGAERLSPERYKGLAWSADFGLLAGVWCGPDGNDAFTVDIDVPLADQMNESLDQDRYEWLGTWEEWLEGIPRLLSASTTANGTFNANMRVLQKHLDDTQEVSLRWSNTPRNVYAFVEHQVLKLQEGKLSRSHALRLSEMPFVFGVNEIPARKLFCVDEAHESEFCPQYRPLFNRSTW